MRKEGIPDVFTGSVMSLYEGARTIVRVDSKLSEDFEVKMGMHQHICCQLFFLQLWWMFLLNWY